MEGRTQHKLNPNISLQQPELRTTFTWRIWERLEGTDVGWLVATVLEKEDKVLSTNKMINNFLVHHRVHQWSRFLAAESRTPAVSSAVGISSDMKDDYTGPNTKIHLTNLILSEAEKEEEVEEKKETSKKAELRIQEDVFKQLANKEQAGQQDEFNLTGEINEEEEETLKDKSIRRRILNWLNEIIHDYYKKKIAETYRREREEGNEFYPSTFYFIRPMTRADRERQKREIWLDHDNQRQKIKKYLDSYWEEKHKKKEASCILVDTDG